MKLPKVKKLKQLEDLAAAVDQIHGDESIEMMDEDSVAPGVAFQTPGSIGGMGNPVAPTPTSLGSGDNFNPQRRKKNKKDKRVLEFSDFVQLHLEK